MIHALTPTSRVRRSLRGLILERIRAIVHEACPEVEETMKWGMPSFVYAGGILCGMAGFKQHAPHLDSGSMRW